MKYWLCGFVLLIACGCGDAAKYGPKAQKGSSPPAAPPTAVAADAVAPPPIAETPSQRQPSAQSAAAPPSAPPAPVQTPPEPVLPAWTSDKEVVNSIGMKFAFIPKGVFTRGAAEDEGIQVDSQLERRRGAGLSGLGTTVDETPHEVTLSRDYFLGVHEVTQAQFLKLMGKNPSMFQGDRINGDSSDYPVDNVTWPDAVAFCQKLSELPEEKAAGRVYRLPTEAEWEYACRAGSTGPFCFGDDVAQLPVYAWFKANGESTTHPVGQKMPNDLGLYDMHGNIEEWCNGFYTNYKDQPLVDPQGDAYGKFRVVRGGNSISPPGKCRSAVRRPCYEENLVTQLSFQDQRTTPNGSFKQGLTVIGNGFRVLLVIPQ